MFELKFADVGEGVHEGEILEIYVNEGDIVKVEQDILEVHTEKVTTAITSPVSGIITKIHFQVGDTIKVGDVIITIDEDQTSRTNQIEKTTTGIKSDEKDDSLFTPSKPFVSKSMQKKNKHKSIQIQTKVTAEVVNDQVLAAPAVRRRAREMDIDLRYIKGSGPAGRIKMQDLKLQSPRTSFTSQIERESYNIIPGTESRIPLKGTRKTISKAMRTSKDNAAHYSYFEEVDMTSLDKLRGQLRSTMEQKGIKITYVALVMKCLVPALRAYPLLNSQLDEESSEIILRDYYNIGISVDTVDGLVVPVVKNVEQKSIWAIAHEIVDLATKARDGKLTLSDITGGTFTITSIGNIGGVMATPIIKYPEVAILGLMKSKLRPVVIEDYGKPEIAIRKMMYLSLSLDHRIVDGAVGARFINELIKYMENPGLLWIDSQ